MFWIIVLSVIAVVLIGAAVYDRVNSGSNWKSRGYLRQNLRRGPRIDGDRDGARLASAHMHKVYQNNTFGGSGSGGPGV
ncbi:hypothetical protein [Calidifontibacter indicus]|uniref:Uncharacterized protein n=1 Tax=Calidifontibacter indicus TaxID=419650 RepID=A0A3D9UPD8_9MICO|nr:hypothetical protein [Calidifontibacter indicus]REF30293.1 hypothetical protein DFJ65_1297 [Calidifontibacter indicus]